VTSFNGQAFSLAYYLFIFFSVEAAFFIAFSHWRRSLLPFARRLTVGFGLLGPIRLLFPLIFRSVPAQTVDLAVMVISLGFLSWSFSPYFYNRSRLGVSFLVGNTLLALIVFGIHNALPGGDTIFSIIWLLWQIGLALLTLASLLQAMNQARVMVIMGFVLFMIGSLLQLILGVTAETASFIRLAEMAAYPILAVAVYLDIFEALYTRSEEYQDISEASLEQIQGLISLFETTKNVTASLDLSQVLDGAAKGVVQTVGVDLSAIALPEEGEATQLRLVATYNSGREGRSEAVTFPVADQPAIKHALERLREIEITTGYDTPQFKFLFAMMGARDEIGPLIIQPLVLRNTAIGVLIVGNPYSKQPFGPTKLQLIKTMANQMAIAIDNARAHQMLVTKSQQLAWTLRNQEQDASRRRAAMEAELKKSRQEVAIISQRLYEQEIITEKSQKQLADYQHQVNQLQARLQSAQRKLDKLTQKNQQLSTLTEAQKEQLDQAERVEKEVATLRMRISELELKASEVETLRQDLADAQQRSRKLARALRLTQAKIQQTAGMPASMTSPQVHSELENLSCGLLISDSGGVINRVNAATGKLFNLDAKNLIGKKLAEITPAETWHRALNKVVSSGENLVTTSFSVNDKVIKASISPMVDPTNQQISGNVVILYDASEEFESQQARDEFVASLSQDLRTPMTSITGYIDLLLGESVGVIADMQRKFLQRVKANIERMDLMLRDLVGVTAIDAGQFDIRPSPLDMAEVIEDAIIGAKAQLEEKEIQLSLELPEQMPPVEADPDSIQQVMANLLSNATKTTPAGGSIGVRAVITGSNGVGGESERWLQISIVDSGGGIAEKDIERVFDRFYSAERPLIHGLGETGIGLSMAKYLIEAHGGKIWLDTEIGKGSTFHFTLLIKDYYNDPWQDLDVPPLDLDATFPDV
jgi:signal transduction histidine kinase